jgi:hypothetical protein
MRQQILIHSAALVVAVSLGYVPSARASAELELYDGSSCASSDCVEITDSGTVITFGTASYSGLVTASGFVTADISVGKVFTMNVETGESQAVLGPGSMDLDTNDVVAKGAGTLTVLWSDVNFAVPVTGVGAIQAMGGPTLSSGITSLVYDTFASASNTLFATGAGNLQTSLTFGPPGSFQSVTGGSVPPGGVSPYSLTQELQITTSGTGHTSGDFTLDVVPEPSAVLLLGTAMLLMVNLIRRRSTKKNRA